MRLIGNQSDKLLYIRVWREQPGRPAQHWPAGIFENSIVRRR